MIRFSLKKYFYCSRKKWFIAIIVLLVLSVILKYIVADEFLPTGEQLTFWDFIFASLSYPFTMLLVIPLLYCYLVADIITEDYEGGYVTFLLSRSSSRLEFFISKVIVVFISSNIFFLIYLMILALVALIYGLPFQGTFYFTVTSTILGSGGTIFNGMVMQYSLFVILLYVLGIILHGHNTVFNNHDNLLYLPLAQGILSMHYPFYYQGLNNLTDISKVMERFNVGYSIVYLSVLLVLLLLVGFIRIRNMNLVVKDDKL
jgi:ABC-type transport system involved in multi-copper enzyme maturation permease subunit